MVPRSPAVPTAHREKGGLGFLGSTQFEELSAGLLEDAPDDRLPVGGLAQSGGGESQHVFSTILLRDGCCLAHEFDELFLASVRNGTVVLEELDQL